MGLAGEAADLQDFILPVHSKADAVPPVHEDGP